MVRKKNQLLHGYLERVSRGVIEDYPGIVAGMIKNHAGVYALYKHDNLYYVGLAKSLMGRIKQHLRDRHAHRWNRFSVYITRNDDHVKQLEALLLRIAMPTGNKVKGNFSRSNNLFNRLRNEMSNADADRRATALGGVAARRRRKVKASISRGSLVLAGLVEKRLPLKAVYKGKTYRATLRMDGYISYNKERFESPTAAAKSIVGRPINGWQFWCYKRGARNWPTLNHLKK